MKSPFLLSFALILLIIQANAHNQQCSLTSDTIQAKILHEFPIQCLKKALRHNWPSVIEFLIKEKQQSHQEQFIKVFQQELKRLQILEEEIVLGQSQTQPIMKWGQNKTHVFITFKLSHRWDSPPCLYTQKESSRLQEEAFSYTNICVVSHQKISFNLNLNLYKPVHFTLKNSQNITLPQQLSNFTSYQFQVKKDGVGTYSSILLKQSPQTWLFLTKTQQNYPLWNQIQTRYPEDFSQYTTKLQSYRLSLKQKLSQS